MHTVHWDKAEAALSRAEATTDSDERKAAMAEYREALQLHKDAVEMAEARKNLGDKPSAPGDADAIAKLEERMNKYEEGITKLNEKFVAPVSMEVQDTHAAEFKEVLLEGLGKMGTPIAMPTSARMEVSPSEFRSIALAVTSTIGGGTPGGSIWIPETPVDYVKEVPMIVNPIVRAGGRVRYEPESAMANIPHLNNRAQEFTITDEGTAVAATDPVTGYVHAPFVHLRGQIVENIEFIRRATPEMVRMIEASLYVRLEAGVGKASTVNNSTAWKGVLAASKNEAVANGAALTLAKALELLEDFDAATQSGVVLMMSFATEQKLRALMSDIIKVNSPRGTLDGIPIVHNDYMTSLGVAAGTDVTKAAVLALTPDDTETRIANNGETLVIDQYTGAASMQAKLTLDGARGFGVFIDKDNSNAAQRFITASSIRTTAA